VLGGALVENLKALDRVAAKIAPGRLPSFAEAHVIKALEEIGEGSVGRLKLSKDLHLGEGEARTLVKHLKKEGLIDVSKKGISLSTDGRKLLRSLRTSLSEAIELPPTSLTLGSSNAAVRVASMKQYVKYGLEQRDAAIMAGAKGATTLVFTGNKLTIPGTHEDALESDPSIRALLLRMNPKEGDVIIIGSADEKIKAELGAKTAALELLKSATREHYSRPKSSR
jgi:predicted transcriptional regulator